jgi:hypothetical protein
MQRRSMFLGSLAALCGLATLPAVAHVGHGLLSTDAVPNPAEQAQFGPPGFDDDQPPSRAPGKMLVGHEHGSLAGACGR